MHTTTHLAAEVMRAGTPGARAAHAALFERVMGRIHRYFRRLIHDPNEAEECLQRTLVLLEQSLSERKYDPERSFNAWMWLKARTVFAQWARERERRPAALPPGEALPAPEDGQGRAERALDADAVLREVERRLGAEVYEAFVLYYEGGLTQAEVAQTLDRDRKTVAKRLAAAHGLIDQLLGKAKT